MAKQIRRNHSPDARIAPVETMCRLTVTTQAAHVRNRKVTPFVFGHNVAVGDVPCYVRDQLVGTEAQKITIDADIEGSPIAFGIRNLAGADIVNPSDDERAAIDSQIIWFGPDGARDALYVLPGKAELFFPTPGRAWYWCASLGEIPAELFAVM